MPRPLNILFSGMIAGDPGHGGAAWAVLQYVLGLMDLGHNVCFVEPIAARAIKPENAPLAQSDNAAYFREVAGSFGLGGGESRAAILEAGTTNTVGVPYGELRKFAASADLLINISGMLTDPALLEPVKTRAYLDLDPAFIQLWNSIQGIDMRFDAHTHFVTIGALLGSPGSAIPDCNRRWQKTLQPVVLERWPVATRLTPPLHDALTTVAQWRGYGSIEHQGVFYGQKAHSLRKIIDLPTRTRTKIAVALAIDPGETKDLAALAENKWTLLDPRQVASTPQKYQRFIQESWAELGIAKSGYVASRCGWFSDRSACYLASGRPVIAEDTGFPDVLPVGEGLLPFRTVDDIVAAIDNLRSDYDRHRLAARRLAEEYFDSRRVLPRLLEILGVL